MFWQACKNGTPEEFHNVMLKFKAICDNAYKYLMDQDRRRYARANFSNSSCYDAVDNNMCETFNWMILRLKRYD